MTLMHAAHELKGEALAKNNALVHAYIVAMHSVLREKGFKYEGQKLLSAQYDRRYSRAGQTIVIEGWHGGGTPGTNRFYGAGKTFQALYSVVNFKFNKLAECRIEFETFEIMESETRARLQEALEAVNKL